MPHTVRWFDRLRIERLVWLLDQHLYELPRAARLATRREVRANLLEAAHDVGITQALRRVGNSRRLAEQYLVAEFGDGPRHSWIAAAYALTSLPLLLNFVFGESNSAFEHGVTAHDPHATGTFVWHGIALLQSPATFTFTDGRASSVGGAWTPTAYALLALVTVVAGRLWRLRRPRRSHTAPTSGQLVRTH